MNIRADGTPTATVLGTLSPGTIIEVKTVEGDWASLDYKGKTGYVATKYIETVDATSSTVGARPGPGQHVEPKCKYEIANQFSTNRIMERLPDFGFLRGKAGNPDMWFWLAATLVAACIIMNIIFKDERGNYSDEWKFYAVLFCFMALSACEIIYLLSSEEPISFFSPDINSVFISVIRFILLFIVIQEQFNILIGLFVHIEDHAAYGFWADKISWFIWGGIIGAIGYFVTLLFQDSPEWWWWALTGGLVAVPIIGMLLSAFRGKGWRSAVIGIPLYLIALIPLIFGMSIITIGIIMVVFTYFIIQACSWALGDGTLERDRITGQYRYVFPDGTTSLFNRHTFNW
ncbi:MAG: SH3 domain-containing protein [Muribaculaceae bacterium]|nr:SH3 domain-containing protein [Muribaculaceae bacterium]